MSSAMTIQLSTNCCFFSKTGQKIMRSHDVGMENPSQRYAGESKFRPSHNRLNVFARIDRSRKNKTSKSCRWILSFCQFCVDSSPDHFLPAEFNTDIRVSGFFERGKFNTKSMNKNVANRSSTQISHFSTRFRVVQIYRADFSSHASSVAIL